MQLILCVVVAALRALIAKIMCTCYYDFPGAPLAVEVVVVATTTAMTIIETDGVPALRRPEDAVLIVIAERTLTVIGAIATRTVVIVGTVRCMQDEYGVLGF